MLTRREHEVANIDRLQSCGKPMLGVDVTIQDDSGVVLPPGALGEICVRGPNVTLGYWNRPDLTETAFAGGWLRTGDIGRFDADGYLAIVDRKHDMIVSGGFNVFPTEVEEALNTHPAVRRTGVIGVPDGRWGERVVAFVVREAGAEHVGEADLQDFVRAAKGPVITPKSILFVEDLPLTPNGKVDRLSLKQHLTALT